MKKIAFLLILTTSLFSCGPSKQDAANYYESIIAKEDSVVSEIHAFTDLFDNAPLIKIDSTHKSIIVHLDNTLKDIEAIKLLKKDDNLKPASIKLLNNLKKLLQVDFANTIKLMNKSKGEIDAVDDEAVNESLDKTEDKLIEYLNDFEAVQAQYAKDYDLNNPSK